MLKWVNIASFAIMCALLSGCVTTGADGIEIADVQKKAISGERTKLGQFLTLNRDCTGGAVPNLRITQAPQHGKVESVQGNILPGKVNGDFAKCKNTKAPGLIQYYTSNPGYIGKDKFKVRISHANGDIKDYNIDIDIVK